MKLERVDNGEGGGGAAATDSSQEAPKGLEIKIGEETKTFGQEDVLGMLGEMEKLKGEAAKAKAFGDVSRRYQMSPEEFASQAEGAFGVLGQLMEAGIIGEDMKPVARKKEDEGGGEDDRFSRFFDKSEKQKSRGGADPGKDSVEALAAAAVRKALDPILEEMTGLKRDTAMLLQRGVSADLQEEFPELSKKEVLRAFNLALQDRSKTIAEHAKDIWNEKHAYEEELEKKLLEKYGVNKEEWAERNAIKEMSPGDQAAMLAQGKTFAFRGSRLGGKNPNAIEPGVAAARFLKARLGR